MIFLITACSLSTSNVNLMDDLEYYFHFLDEQNKLLSLNGDLNCDISRSVLISIIRRRVRICLFFSARRFSFARICDFKGVSSGRA